MFIFCLCKESICHQIRSSEATTKVYLTIDSLIEVIVLKIFKMSMDNHTEMFTQPFSSTNEMYYGKYEKVGEGLYQCSHCSKGFSASGNLNRHMRRHTGDRSYRCSYCECSFIENYVLTRQLRIPNMEKQYHYTICREIILMPSL